MSGRIWPQVSVHGATSATSRRVKAVEVFMGAMLKPDGSAVEQTGDALIARLWFLRKLLPNWPSPAVIASDHGELAAIRSFARRLVAFGRSDACQLLGAIVSVPSWVLPSRPRTISWWVPAD